MKNRHFYSLLMVIMFCYPVFSQNTDWKEYSSNDFNIKFSIPSNWEVEIGKEDVFGMSNERMIGFQLFKPQPNTSIEQWKDEVLKKFALSNFDFITENQSVNINNINILISEAAGYGIEFESQLYFYIICIKRETRPFIAFTFCPVDDLAQNEKTMKDILLSFSELVK